MKRRLTVHVGTAKTGSTSIQQLLKTRSQPLAACGILAQKINPSLLHHSRWAQIAEKIRRSDAERIVLSSEMLSAPKHQPACVECLCELAARADLDVEIVGYVRPQWQRLESGYTQQVKMGRQTQPFEQFMLQMFEDNRLDYNLVFSPFRAAFGERVRVFPLERSRLPRGLLAHFLELLGVEAGRISLEGLRYSNQRPGAKEMEVLRLVPMQPKRRWWQASLSKLLDDDSPFAALDHAAIRRIETRFRDANARFARDYGIDADGVLFRDPVDAGRHPNMARWQDLSADERRLVSAYVHCCTGIYLGDGAAAATHAGRSKLRSAGALLLHRRGRVLLLSTQQRKWPKWRKFTANLIRQTFIRLLR